MRGLMRRELEGALVDFPQALLLRLPDGTWREVCAAIDAVPSASAGTLDGLDLATEGVTALVRADELPEAPEALVGRAVKLGARRLSVASVSRVPGDGAVSLTLIRRAVAP